MTSKLREYIKNVKLILSPLCVTNNAKLVTSIALKMYISARVKCIICLCLTWDTPGKLGINILVAFLPKVEALH